MGRSVSSDHMGEFPQKLMPRRYRIAPFRIFKRAISLKLDQMRGINGSRSVPSQRRKAMSSKLTAIDLFCGAGGLSEGFRQAGFHVLAGQDFDDIAGRTFAATHPEATFIGGPIQQVTPQQLLDAAGIATGELDVIVGGPPCQGYSVYNHRRGAQDPRASLFREYLRIV